MKAILHSSCCTVRSIYRRRRKSSNKSRVHSMRQFREGCAHSVLHYYSSAWCSMYDNGFRTVRVRTHRRWPWVSFDVLCPYSQVKEQSGSELLDLPRSGSLVRQSFTASLAIVDGLSKVEELVRLLWPDWDFLAQLSYLRVCSDDLHITMPCQARRSALLRTFPTPTGRRNEVGRNGWSSKKG